MDSIILIDGLVDYKITLDPSVWIFDDQKIDLNADFFSAKDSGQAGKDDQEDYTKAISKYWEREIQEGAVFPKTLKTEKRFEKEKLITGTFGMSLRRFIQNASPKMGASQMIIETVSEKVAIPLDKGLDAILAFSKDGKPLKEDGPVHVYFSDGSNKNNPIKNVKKFIIE